MSLWWLEAGWTETCCGHCGATIYPEGDPDWGLCLRCMEANLDRQRWEAEQAEAELRAYEERYRDAPESQPDLQPQGVSE